MIYAGVGSADTDVQSAIWPHSYNVAKRLTRNMSMNRYACSPELDGQSYMYNRNTTALNGIGTFCHEFSHVLGLQDHYDVQVNDTRTKVRYTPGQWDLMDAGSYNCPQNRSYTTSCSPANMSSFERFSLGWLDPRYLEISDTTFVLKSIQENDGLVLTSKKDNEYYFVDFRLLTGFDKGLPNKGVLIWHINYDRYSWTYNEVNTSDPMKVDLIEADGKADMYSVSGDAFPTNRVNSFNGFVTWSGDSLGLEIYDIKIVDDHAEFKTRGNRTPRETVSSSSAKVSSSSVAASSSSKNVSSSSRIASSSSRIVSSSSQIASSSSLFEKNSSIAEATSSSSEMMSSSSDASSVLESSKSSSSKGTIALDKKNSTMPNVRISVMDGVLMVHSKIAGRKTVNLFDANGTLLKTEMFYGESCEIRLGEIRGKSFVIATVENEGRIIKSYKVRMN